MTVFEFLREFVVSRGLVVPWSTHRQIVDAQARLVAAMADRERLVRRVVAAHLDYLLALPVHKRRAEEHLEQVSMLSDVLSALGGRIE